MCGRFTLTDDNRERVAELLGVPVDELLEEHFTPRWNIAPTDGHWIVRGALERREARWARWGLVNHWARDRRGAARQINARGEGLRRSRAFREAYEQRRCAVPADGFFEWTGERKDRRPIWFHRPDNGIFFFAGLYERARLPGEAESSTSFTIITTGPNAIVEPVHDRMPVILDEDSVDDWLYARQEPARLDALLTPAADALLVATAVSRRANSVKNDDPSVLEQAEAETQEALF